jgi:hypothetical protein
VCVIWFPDSVRLLSRAVTVPALSGAHVDA